MIEWLKSSRGAVFLSAVAYLTFLGRAFLDWRYEYPAQDPSGAWVTPGVLAYMLLAGAWLWGILAAQRGQRRGWVVCLIMALLLDIALALATFFIFCPPWTACQGWPNAWPWNWSNLITGLAAGLAGINQIRKVVPTD